MVGAKSLLGTNFALAIRRAPSAFRKITSAKSQESFRSNAKSLRLIRKIAFSDFALEPEEAPGISGDGDDDGKAG